MKIPNPKSELWKSKIWKSVVAGLLFLLFPMIGTAETGPKLVCDQPVYEFGQVDQSAVVTNVFVVRNEGDATFVAGMPRSTCGCTVAKLEKKMIGPGETVELTVVFRAKGQGGPQKKAVYLRAADDQERVLALYMKGTVIRDEPSTQQK